MRLLFICILLLTGQAVYAQNSVNFGKGTPGDDDFEQLSFYRTGTIIYTYGKSMQMHRIAYSQQNNVLNLVLPRGSNAIVTIRKKKLSVSVQKTAKGMQVRNTGIFYWLPKDAATAQGIEYSSRTKSAADAIEFVRKYFFTSDDRQVSSSHLY